MLSWKRMSFGFLLGFFAATTAARSQPPIYTGNQQQQPTITVPAGENQPPEANYPLECIECDKARLLFGRRRDRPRRLGKGACLHRFGLGCWAHHDEFGCSSLHSELRFIFGSCRAFFGERCNPGPPIIPTPPGYALPPGHWR